jgi:hypothetical protein
MTIPDYMQDNAKWSLDVSSDEPITVQGALITGREFLMMSAPRNMTFKFPKKGIIAWIQRLFKNENGWVKIKITGKVGECKETKNADGTSSISVSVSVKTE